MRQQNVFWSKNKRVNPKALKGKKRSGRKSDG